MCAACRSVNGYRFSSCKNPDISSSRTSEIVIPDQAFVIPDLIRDPVPRRDWIAGQARNDNELLQ
jgi:hypothetical protein